MKLICGPMATISHPAFRILIEKFGGCDEYFTEMINAGSLLTGGPFEKFYIDPSPNPEKIVWQLTGHDYENMVKASQILVDLPGIGIDINMGCSAPDIYKYGAGISWMLKDIKETEEMVQGINQVVRNHNSSTGEKKRLSVKLRLGDDNFTDEGFYNFTDMLVRNGVELLTLHPRTKKEKLARPARYFYCENLSQRYENQVPVYLNGNVKDFNSASYAAGVCPSVKGIMISRAAVSKPWIFAELAAKLKNPAENQDIYSGVFYDSQQNGLRIDMQQIALDFIKDVELYQPVEFWKTRLQRYFTYYGENFLFAHYAQTQFINSKDNDDLRNRILSFFEKCPEERFKSVSLET